MFGGARLSSRCWARKPMAALALLLLAFVLALPAAALAQTVTRGPYLQKGTPTGIIVRWQTDLATESVVDYGPSPTDLSFVADNLTPTTEHEVELQDLSPATTYFYSIGTLAEVLAGGDADHMFITSPEIGIEQPTRIWVVGDSGTADANARAVRDRYLELTGTQYTNLFLMLGDNAYSDGTQNEYQAALFDMYPSLLRQTVVWPTLCNHDGRSADSATQSGVYYDILSLPTLGEAGGSPSGTEAYYSFDYSNIHFIVLDSFGTDRSPTGAMMTWLQNDLMVHDQPWVVAFWHHPPYSKGSHDSDTEIRLIDMRANALPILEAGGVDLVMTGHSHVYERSFLIDGHYGNSDSFNATHQIDPGDGRVTGTGPYEKPGDFIGEPNAGAVYVVAGTSGKIGVVQPDAHEAMLLRIQELGSVILEIDGDTLAATFLDSIGSVQDTFRIVKVPFPSVEIVVDNQDPNTAATGIWRQSSGPNPWEANSVYNSNAGSTFRWLPLVPVAGDYEVYAWWTFHNNRSTTVPYRIGHNGVVDMVVRNQKDAALGGQWNLLGSFTFDAGGGGYVEVSAENGQASADAVRLVPVP